MGRVLKVNGTVPPGRDTIHHPNILDSVEGNPHGNLMERNIMLFIVTYALPNLCLRPPSAGYKDVLASETVDNENAEGGHKKEATMRAP